MNTPVWLSHHRGAGLSRCFDVLGLKVCARCSGLYPALVATLVAEDVFGAPRMVPRLLLALEVALLVPALWSVFRESAEPNEVRFWTGAGLGAALGHAAMAGFQRGYGDPQAVLPLGTGLAAMVWLWDRQRQRWRNAASS